MQFGQCFLRLQQSDLEVSDGWHRSNRTGNGSCVLPSSTAAGRMRQAARVRERSDWCAAAFLDLTQVKHTVETQIF